MAAAVTVRFMVSARDVTPVPPAVTMIGYVPGAVVAARDTVPFVVVELPGMTPEVKEIVAPVGAPVDVSVIGPVNDPLRPTFATISAVPPAASVISDGLMATFKEPGVTGSSSSPQPMMATAPATSARRARTECFMVFVLPGGQWVIGGVQSCALIPIDKVHMWHALEARGMSL